MSPVLEPGSFCIKGVNFLFRYGSFDALICHPDNFNINCFDSQILYLIYFDSKDFCNKRRI